MPAPADAHRTDHLAALTAVEPTARRLCVLINAPMMKLPPELRQTVGYIGLLNLITGICLLLFAML